MASQHETRVHKDKVNLTIRVAAASGYSRLEILGNIPELGSWQLARAIKLEYQKSDGEFRKGSRRESVETIYAALLFRPPHFP